MSGENNSCPAESRLRDFASGRLSESDAISIQDHVRDCSKCGVIVSSLNAETITNRARRSIPATPVDDDSAKRDYSGLLAQLKKIPGEQKTLQGADTSVTPGELEAGRTLRNYLVEEKIAESGMGIVYRARHLKLHREVALKVLRSHVLANPESIHRFRQEITASGRLDHPNIVVAHDADEVGGIHFLVMELVAGQDLSRIVAAHGPLSVPDACDIIRQTADALQHIMDNGMVHRDVKPSNLMLNQSGQVKLLDLGLAKLRGDDSCDDRGITATGQVMGTVDFMSPEQADDSRTADIPADIYSLGCTFYFLLTGASPFRRESRLQTLMAHAGEERAPLPERTPGEIVELLDDMIVKNPAERPQYPHLISDRIAGFATGSDLKALANLASKAPQAEIDTESTAMSPSVSIASANCDQESPADPQASLTKPRRKSHRFLRGLFWSAFVAILSVVIFIQTDEGEIVVEVADEISQQVKVNILREGEPVIEGWEVTSGNSVRNIRTGRVNVEIVGPLSEELTFKFAGDNATVDRGDSVVVRIFRRKPSSPPPPPPPTPGRDSDLLTAFDAVRESGRKVWARGDTEGNLYGLVPMPAKLPTGERWQLERVAPRGEIIDLKWSPDGTKLAVGSEDAQLRVYELIDNELALLRCFASPIEQPFRCVSWSADSKWLLGTQFSGPQILVFNVETGLPGPTLDHLNPHRIVWDATFHPQRLEVVYQTHGQVRLWEPDLSGAVDAQDGEGHLVPIELGEATCRGLAWNPDGNRIAVGCSDGRVVVADTKGTTYGSYQIHKSTVRKLKWINNSQIISSDEQRSALWSANTGKIVRELPDMVDAIAVNAHVIGTQNTSDPRGVRYSRVRILDDEGRLVFNRKIGEISGAISNRNPTRNLFTTGTSGELQIWQFSNGEPELLCSTGKFISTAAAAWSQSTNKLAARSTNGETQIWHATGVASKRLPKSRHVLRTLEWADDDTSLLIAGYGDSVQKQRLDGSTSGSIAPQGYFARLSPDGRCLLTTADESRKLQIQSVRTGAREQIELEETDRCDEIRISTDGHYGAVRVAPEIWRVVDLESKVLVDFGFQIQARDVFWLLSKPHLLTSGSNCVALLDAESCEVKWKVPQSNWQYVRGGGFVRDDKVITWSSGRLVTRNLKDGREQSNQPTDYLLNGMFGMSNLEPSPSSPRFASYSRNRLSPVHVWNEQDMLPDWFCIDIEESLSASFTAAGQMIEPTPQKAKHFAWIVERSDGAIDVLSRQEFLQRMSQPASAVKRPQPEERTEGWQPGPNVPFRANHFGLVAAPGELLSADAWQVGLQAPQFLTDFTATLFEVSVSNDGTWLAIQDHIAGITIYRFDNGRYRCSHRLAPNVHVLGCVCFSQDSQKLFAIRREENADRNPTYLAVIRTVGGFGVEREIPLPSEFGARDTGPTDSAVWSSDGRMVAWSSHGTIWLLDLENEEVKSVYRIESVDHWDHEYRGKVALAWEPNSGRLVVQEPDGTLCAIEIDSGHKVELKSSVRTQPSSNTRIEYSPNGRQLLAPDLLDARTFQHDSRLELVPGSAAWSPNGKKIAFMTNQAGGTLEIRDSETLEIDRAIPIGYLPGFNSQMSDGQVHWTRSNPERLLVAAEGQLIQIDPESGDVIQRTGTELGVSGEMYRAPDASCFAAAFYDGTTRIFTPQGVSTAALKTHRPGESVTVRPSNGGDMLLVYNRARSEVAVWNARAFERLKRITVPQLSDIEWINGTSMLVTYRDRNEVELLNLKSGNSQHILVSEVKTIRAVRMTSGSNSFCGLNEENELVHYSRPEHRLLWRYATESRPVQPPVWNDDESAVILLCQESLIAIDAVSGEALWDTEVEATPQTQILVDTGFVTLLSDSTVRKYQLSDGKHIRIYDSQLENVAPDWAHVRSHRLLLPNGAAVVGMMHYPLRAFSTASGEPLWSSIPVTGAYDERPKTVTFSAAGEWLNASGGLVEHLFWMKWQGDLAVATTQKEIEKELSHIEGDRYAAALMKSRAVRVSAGRRQWPKGAKLSSNEQRELAGLVSFPTPLKDGRRWNMVREAPNWFISSIRWSPDGTNLTVAPVDGHAVRLYKWDGERLKYQRRFCPKGAFAYGYASCEFSPNGSLLAASTRASYGESRLVIWETTTGEMLAIIRPQDVDGSSEAFGPIQWTRDSKHIVGCCRDAWVCDIGGQAEVIVAHGNSPSSIKRVCISEESGVSCVLYDDGTLRTYDSTARFLNEVKAHPGESELIMSPCQKFLLQESRGSGSNPHVWRIDGEGLTPVRIPWTARGSSISVGNWSSDGSLLLTGFASGGGSPSLRAWERDPDWKVKRTFTFPRSFGAGFQSVAWNPAQPLIAAAFEGLVATFDTTTGKHNLHWLGAPSTVADVSMHSRGFNVAFGDGHVFETGYDGDQQSHPLNKAFSSRWKSATTPQFKMLVRSDHVERNISVLDRLTNRLLSVERADCNQVRSAGDSFSFVTVVRADDKIQQSTLHLWNPGTESHWAVTVEDRIDCYAWSDDREQLAIACGEGALRIYQTGSDTPTGETRISGSDVRSLCWSADSLSVAIQARLSLELVDTRSHSAVWQVDIPGSTADGVWFDEDGYIRRAHGSTLVAHSPLNGSLPSLKSIELDHSPHGKTMHRSSRNESVVAAATFGPSSVFDIETGELKWSFINGSDRSGTPVLIRWRPSGQLINPEEAASQVFYLVESKERAGQVDVLEHKDFIKLLPDDLQKSEEAVFE